MLLWTVLFSLRQIDAQVLRNCNNHHLPSIPTTPQRFGCQVNHSHVDDNHSVFSLSSPLYSTASCLLLFSSCVFVFSTSFLRKYIFHLLWESFQDGKLESLVLIVRLCCMFGLYSRFCESNPALSVGLDLLKSCQLPVVSNWDTATKRNAIQATFFLSFKTLTRYFEMQTKSINHECFKFVRFSRLKQADSALDWSGKKTNVHVQERGSKPGRKNLFWRVHWLNNFPWT